MADAKPLCPFCGSTMRPLFQTFFCLFDCDKVERRQCPACGTKLTRPFQKTSYLPASMTWTTQTAWACIPNGHVFDLE